MKKATQGRVHHWLFAAILATAMLAGCGSNETGTAGRSGAAGPAAPAQTRLLAGSSSVTAADYTTAVQQLYIAYFGRPADTGGLANFTAMLAGAGVATDIQGLNSAYSSNATVKTLVDAFGTSAESAALYTGTTTDFVNAIYAHVLNRASDSAGLQFWVNAIDQGILSRGNAALSIMAGALTNTSAQGLIDAQVVSKKVALGVAFTATLQQNASQASAYSGDAAAATARNMLSSVTSTTDPAKYQSTISSTISTLVAAATDTRPLQLSFSLALPHVAMGTLVPYQVVENQGIAFTSVTWYFDGVVGGYTSGYKLGSAVQVWNRPGQHTVRVVVTASNGRSAELSSTAVAVEAPLASGQAHSCALTPTGAVNCWGADALHNSPDLTPVAVPGLSGVMGLAAGDGHTCALKGDGTVACWGDNIEGQLGNATTYHSGSVMSPVAVDGLSNVVALAAGRYHTCALKDAGTVVCFGQNTENELGTAGPQTQSVAPVAIAGLSNVVALSAGGGYFTCALKADTTVACWGDNESAQLGTGVSSPSQTGTPTTVLTAAGTPLSGVLAIRSGQNHTCAIVNDGSYSVYCWGDNSYRQTSSGAGNVRYPATKVTGLDHVLMLSTSMSATCTLDAYTAFKCWGSNDYGESSAQAGTPSYIVGPTVIPGLQGTSAPAYISGGHQFTCMLMDGGTAKCFGFGNDGELGNGTQVSAPTPQVVTAPANSFWSWR